MKCGRRAVSVHFSGKRFWLVHLWETPVEQNPATGGRPETRVRSSRPAPVLGQGVDPLSGGGQVARGLVTERLDLGDLLRLLDVDGALGGRVRRRALAMGSTADRAQQVPLKQGAGLLQGAGDGRVRGRAVGQGLYSPTTSGSVWSGSRGDARGDASGMALLAAPAAVIGLVRVQLGGALAGATSCAGAHTGHGVQFRCKCHAVMAVRAGDCQAERRAAGVGNRVALGARAAAVGRVRPRRRPSF